ncbi:MAG: TonB-dependent receptor [Sediminibacterium magnilacihabitans]|nr:TonB-dependent receptor [Sediminibacterium magnilacihabitans]PQV59491.1 Fe(3+) dicitrate transport protein [Sediminibacterium magnilacihabitans]
MKISLYFFIIFFSVCTCYGQRRDHKTDTSQVHILDSIRVRSVLKNSSTPYMGDIAGTGIFAGKKTFEWEPDAAEANLAQNNGRTTLARVPGLVIWDMDGAGTQLNIGTRGTDAHRSIEMNMRQNGYNTNSDLFGYPEDHYTPALQAVERFQYVRGSAALQFGPQFGGMLNYVMKKGDSTRPFVIETEQSAGSNRLVNSYNSIGGTVGRLNYFAYADFRHGDGWRADARFDYQSYYAGVYYHISNTAVLSLQFSRMNYLQQIAGGLTDAQFQQDARQATRTRNYFNPEINIPALNLEWTINSRTKIQVQASGVFGERNSVQFINTPDIRDTFNTAIGSYNPRQVDRDYYSGIAFETRLLHQYTIGNLRSTLAAGMRLSTQQTKRKQKGVGTSGFDYDLTLVKGYGIDLKLRTDNQALFAENIFQVSNAFSITPGLRAEHIQSKMDGVINNATVPVSYGGDRWLPLAGLGLQYEINKGSQLYGNISQAYRPYLYAAVTPATQVDHVDPNLKDSKGYDIELGWRGRNSDLIRYDISFFYLYYGNRVGLITVTDPVSGNYLYSTNIGNSGTTGIDCYLDGSLTRLFTGSQNRNTDLRLFASVTYNRARYTSGVISKGGVNTSVKGNQVENTPDWIVKTGLQFRYRSFNTTLQYSYNSSSYSDAFNTGFTATGVIGIVPSWHIIDWTAAYQTNAGYRFSAGINNLLNTVYFNRRINMYPGPGILPADKRTFYVSIGVKI